MKDLFNNKHFKKDILPLRIPYMGSKQKIAKDLISEMLKVKPNAKYFVDLFGGGGAMSFVAAQMGLKVIYNEKQESLVNFIEYIFNRIKNNERSKFGIFPEEFYNFVSREEFLKQKNENTIFGQFCRICYSFGNNQKNYLFNSEIEVIKRLGHNIIMFQCEESLKEFNKLKNVNFELSNAKTWNQRRLDYKVHWNFAVNNHPLMLKMVKEGFVKNKNQLTSFKKKEYLKQNNLPDTDFNKRVDILGHLEQLQQLERLKQLECFNIKLFNLDYKDVVINTPVEETIVYLDPPYRNTAKYIEDKDFNYLELDKWFLDSKYTCFLSEYNSPHKVLFSIQKQKTYNNSNVDIRVYATENLYVNK